MEYEVKKIMDAWETRCEYDQTPYTLWEYLEQIRQKQSECLQILEEDGNTLYDEVSKERLDTLMQQWNDVFYYATMLRRRMSELLDEPFKRDLGTGAVEYLSHINLSDYQTENTVGLTEVSANSYRYRVEEYRVPKRNLTFSDFLGGWVDDPDAFGKNTNGGINAVVASGMSALGNTQTAEALLAGGQPDPNMAMFANIFAGQYAAMEESGAFEESEIADLQGYLDMLMVQGEYEYEYDSASTCVKIANHVLDLFVVPNLLEAILGQELLTGRELDNGERAMKVVVGVLNAVGMRQALSANGIVNVTSVEALSVMGKVAIVNGAADLTAYGVSWIGEELGLPMPVTVLLSLVLGITVDYELGCYVFRNGDGSILRRIFTAKDDVTDTVRDIIKGVENGDIPLTNVRQKGNYGEMKMDIYFEEQGYKRISLERITDLDAPLHHGIDGVYYNPNGRPPYIIAEAKYGSARLSSLVDGTPQMSDKWIIDRLENTVDEEFAIRIKQEMILNSGNVGTILVHVSPDGSMNVIELIDGVKQ